METEECSTGILIDIEAQGNNEMEQPSAVSLSMFKNETETLSDCRMKEWSVEDSSPGILYKLCDIRLEAVLKTDNDMLSVPKSHLETPSPQSMKMITKEACKIIEQLHSSPIESIEGLLEDEKFPVTYFSDECYFNEHPEDFEDLCQKNTGFNIKSISATASSSSIYANATTHEDFLDNQSISMHLGGNIPKDLPTLHKTKSLKCVGVQQKQRNMYETVGVKTPEKGNKIIYKEKDPQKTKNIVLGNIKKKVHTNISAENILKTLNVSNCRLSDSKCSSEESLNESKCTSNTSQKIAVKLNKRNLQNTPIGAKLKNSNIFPRFADVRNQPLFCEKLAPSKSTSLVATPSVPKPINQIKPIDEKLQKANKRMVEPHSKKAAFLSNGSSLKKNFKTPTESTGNLMKSRLLNSSHIPNSGTGFTTPLQRRNSLSKTAVLPNNNILTRSLSLHYPTKISQISRPIVSSVSRNISTAVSHKSNFDAFKKPAASTSSKLKFKSQLNKSAHLSHVMNDILPRELFPEKSKNTRRK